ncbi:MAG: hypothetical protein IPK60_24150 [Sandaracinaceae bacterium]|nr:hypothetical protein [Sandaracinaceae bacterium]
MNSTHLEPETLDALAHGREDLVSVDALTHAQGCEECARQLQAIFLSSQRLSAAMREAPALSFNVDALVERALDNHAEPIPLRTVVGGGVAALAIAAFAWMQTWRSDWNETARTRAHDALVALSVLDGAVREHVPMGWGLVALTMAVLALASVALLGRLLAWTPTRATLAMSTFGVLFWLSPAPSARALDFVGEWPAAAPISVDAENVPVGEALQNAATAAHLDLVVHAPTDMRVSVHMHDAAPKEVFAAILEGEAIVVERVAQRVSIRPASPSPTAPPAPVPAAAPAVVIDADNAHYPDRTGQNVVVGATEHVKDAVAFGGSLQVSGHVHGDAAAFGGNIVIHCGGVVDGDTVSFGGAVIHDSPCDGQPTIAPTATGGAQQSNRTVSFGSERHEDHSSWLEEAFSDVASLALVFLLGLVVMRWAPMRFDTTRNALLTRPLRSFLAGIGATFALVFVSVALCITLIGIPVALFLVLGAALAAYVGAGLIAVLLGHALPIAWLRERPVAQFATGLVIVFAFLQLPGIGMALFICACIAAFGAIALTRLGTRHLA